MQAKTEYEPTPPARIFLRSRTNSNSRAPKAINFSIMNDNDDIKVNRQRIGGKTKSDIMINNSIVSFGNRKNIIENVSITKSEFDATKYFNISDN